MPPWARSLAGSRRTTNSHRLSHIYFLTKPLRFSLALVASDSSLYLRQGSDTRAAAAQQRHSWLLNKDGQEAGVHTREATLGNSLPARGTVEHWLPKADASGLAHRSNRSMHGRARGTATAHSRACATATAHSSSLHKADAGGLPHGVALQPHKIKRAKRLKDGLQVGLCRQGMGRRLKPVRVQRGRGAGRRSLVQASHQTESTYSS